jgi:hypothetical protein
LVFVFLLLLRSLWFSLLKGKLAEPYPGRGIQRVGSATAAFAAALGFPLLRGKLAEPYPKGWLCYCCCGAAAAGKLAEPYRFPAALVPSPFGGGSEPLLRSSSRKTKREYKAAGKRKRKGYGSTGA